MSPTSVAFIFGTHFTAYGFGRLYSHKTDDLETQRREELQVKQDAFNIFKWAAYSFVTLSSIGHAIGKRKVGPSFSLLVVCTLIPPLSISLSFLFGKWAAICEKNSQQTKLPSKLP